MRPTMIVHAHPITFESLAREPKRFSGTRKGFCARLHAAWLVFSGRADALSWEFWERVQQLPPQSVDEAELLETITHPEEEQKDA